jgi:hypothetical protein
MPTTLPPHLELFLSSLGVIAKTQPSHAPVVRPVRRSWPVVVTKLDEDGQPEF